MLRAVAVLYALTAFGCAASKPQLITDTGFRIDFSDSTISIGQGGEIRRLPIRIIDPDGFLFSVSTEPGTACETLVSAQVLHVLDFRRKYACEYSAGNTSGMLQQKCIHHTLNFNQAALNIIGSPGAGIFAYAEHATFYFDKPDYSLRMTIASSIDPPSTAPVPILSMETKAGERSTAWDCAKDEIERIKQVLFDI